MMKAPLCLPLAALSALICFPQLATSFVVVGQKHIDIAPSMSHRLSNTARASTVLVPHKEVLELEHTSHTDTIYSIESSKPFPRKPTLARPAFQQRKSRRLERTITKANRIARLSHAMRRGVYLLGETLMNAAETMGHEEESMLRSNRIDTETISPDLARTTSLRGQNPAPAVDKTDRSMPDQRSRLPQYNLEGIWVGEFEGSGYEMINVTYVGDTMVAHKVVGDDNVSPGEISFQVKLSPFPCMDIFLEPRPVGLADQSNDLHIPRFHGKGQVARPGSASTQWVDGQMSLIGDEFFSFNWIPTGQHVTFGRPSLEMALQMLRKSSVKLLLGKDYDSPPSLDDDVSVWKEYLAEQVDRSNDASDEIGSPSSTEYFQ